MQERWRSWATPLGDHGCAIDSLWGHGVEGCVAGMLLRGVALRPWSYASGLSVDGRALACWWLFAAVKGIAIWTSAAKQFVDGGLADPVLVVSGFHVAPARRDPVRTAGAVRRMTPTVAQILTGDAIAIAGLAAETGGAGPVRDAEVAALYRRMAQGRVLVLPPM